MRVITSHPTNSPAVETCLAVLGKYYIAGLTLADAQFTVRQTFSNVLNSQFTIKNTEAAFNRSVVCALQGPYFIAPVVTSIYNVSFVTPNVLQFFYDIKFKFPTVSTSRRRSLTTNSQYQDVRAYYGNLTQVYLKPYSVDGNFLEVYNQYCSSCLSQAVFSNITFGPLVLNTPKPSKAPVGADVNGGSSDSNTQMWLGIGLGVGLCVLIFVNLLLIQFCISGAAPFQSEPKPQPEAKFDVEQVIERSFDVRGSDADSVSVKDSEAFAASLEGSMTDSRRNSRAMSNASESGYGMYSQQVSDVPMRMRSGTGEGSVSGGMRPREGSIPSRPRVDSLSRPRGPSMSLAPGLPSLPEKEEDLM